MRRGPSSTPARLKLLYGNPGKRRILQDEVEVPLSVEPPEPPEFLPPEAKAEWERLAGILHQANLLTEVDTEVFACYCLAVDRLRRATKALNESGEVAGPLAGIARAAAKDVCRFGAEFGMGPSARRRI